MANGVSRILIANDHEIVLRGLRILLEPQIDLEAVAEAHDARTAVEKAVECSPDIAIITYRPPFNGSTLLSELKARLPKLKVIIYTAHGGEDEALEMLRAGANGYVLKSETEQHLLAAIRAVANGGSYVGLRAAGSHLDQVPPHRHARLRSQQGMLTPRQVEVVRLLARGITNPEVAHDLNISIKTVETHRAAIMHKLDLGNTADLVRYAIRNHLIDA
ncbi:MAG: response regulator transcription factor [Rhizobiaceae bacterium]|nr:MAG: response regulator transcription factor [Rhizobiaceae bacterium]